MTLKKWDDYDKINDVSEYITVQREKKKPA